MKIFGEYVYPCLAYHLTSLVLIHSNKIVSTYTSQFLQLLHSSLPAVFLDYFHTFLASSLASLPAHLSDPPHTEELLSSVPPPMSIEDIKPPSPHLSRLGMLPRYSAVLTAVAYQEIERIVKEEVGKGWEVRRMPRIRQRVAVGLVNWIASCFESESVWVGDGGRTGC
jgi:anaphase-promoting complex subunit 2